jgi:hypothetical protein
MEVDMKKTYRIAAMLYVLVLGGVGLAAEEGYDIGWFYMSGQQSRLYHFLAADTEGWSLYGYGPTFIQVRIDGMSGGSCTHGSGNGFGCADSAHTDLITWRSRAAISYNITPYGCYTATVMFYVDNSLRINYPIGQCWNAPEPEPGDGYCVTYDYDTGWGEWVCNTSPIMIDTGTNKVRDTLETIGWTKHNSDVAFLALDRNGNGVIDNGSELFGGHTVAGKSNGFAALRALANDIEFGYLDATHGGELFSQLLLWHDRNQDGVSQPDELSPASSVLEAIGLGYTLTTDADKAGNLFTYKGWARRPDPKAKNNVERALSAPTREFTIFDVNLAKQ